MAGTSKEGGTGTAGRSTRGKPFRQDTRFKEPELLGSGGKARVWKVEDRGARPFAPDRIVAVKELNKEAEPGDADRLRGEGGEDRRFEHPNVVRIFDLRGGPRSPFLVLEYIPGEDCKSLLERHGPLTPERVVEIGIQLCAAMGCLHAADLVHRDIKPANLMLVGDPDGDDPVRLKLIDLGIAQAPGDPEHTRQGDIVGTEPYIAPEVAIGEWATEASDVYGAGAVLYELVTGKRVRMLTRQEKYQGRRDEPLPIPRALNPAVPACLSDVIMRALAVDPDRRFPGAAAMSAALEEGTAASEAPTTVIAGPHDALTELLPGPGREPLVLRLVDALPSWLRQRLPPEWRQGEPVHWYIFLLALVAAPVLFTVLFLPIVIRVVVTLCALPLWLLTILVLLGSGLGWFVREESRRQAAGRWGRAVAAWGRRLGTALAAGARRRGSAAAAALRRRQLEASARRQERSATRSRRPLEQRSAAVRTPRRGWTEVKREQVDPFLRSTRSRAAEVGSAAGAWAGWLGRRAYLALLVALVFCLAFWLGPVLQSRVALQPQGHRVVLTVLPAALWTLIAVVALLKLRASRARPRRLLLGGLAMLASLTVLGMLMPSFASWLEPRFWPEEPVAEAEEGDPDRATGPSATERSSRETARLVSRRLAVRVRSMEGRWIQLIEALDRNGWSLDGEAKAAVRAGADAHVSRLNGWEQIPQYEFRRRRALSWLADMRRVALELTSRDCRRFTIEQAGASAVCAG